MSLHSSPSAPARRQRARRLFLENLEDRSLMATLTVNTTADGRVADGHLSLREAIAVINLQTTAELDAGGLAQVSGTLGNHDTVLFESALGPITLTSAQIRLARNVDIDGGEGITIQRSSAVGTADFRIFEVLQGVTAELRALKLSNGFETNLNGGGAVLIAGGTDITLRDVTIADNTTTLVGGGIYLNGGNLLLINSTVSGNTATTNGTGGGIAVLGAGTIDIVNSTISGNATKTSGGGIENFGGVVNVINSTITGNRADSDGNGSGVGGGIETAPLTLSTTTLHNSIVAGNFKGSGAIANDLDGLKSVVVSFSHNIICLL
jgi:hypothetical protein